MQDYNQPVNDYGATPNEQSPTQELQAYQDLQPVTETQPQPEQNGQTGKRSKKKTSNLYKTLSSFLIASVATVTLGANITPIKEAFSPIDRARAELVELSVSDTELSYQINIASEVALYVLLHNDFTDRRADLINGENSGTFTELKAGMSYTLSVVGKGFLGESAVAVWKVKTTNSPNAPLLQTEIDEVRVELNAVYYTVTTQSDIPLKAVLYNQTFRQEQRLENGTGEGSFENLPMGATYTFAIVGEGLDGERELQTQEITIPPHPLDLAQAQIDGVSVDMNGVYFTVTTQSDTPLKAVLYNQTFRQEQRLENGTVEGSFENLPMGATYTFAIVGEGLDGERELQTQEITIPPHPLDLAQAQIDEVSVDMNGVYFTVTTQSDTPLKAVLYNETFRQEQRLENGTVEGSFENLPMGATYTLAIVGEGLDGERELQKQEVTIPHPIEFTEAIIERLSPDGNNIYFSLIITGVVPLEQLGLEIVLSSNGTELSRKPFANTEGGTDPNGGEMFDFFANVQEGQLYTVTVVGQGANGETVLASQQIEIPHPLDFTTAEIVELAPDGASVYYTVNLTSVVDLETLGIEIVLYQNGQVVQRKPYDKTNGGFTDVPPDADPTVGESFGSFDNLQAGDYVVAVVGKRLDKEVELTRTTVTLEEII